MTIFKLGYNIKMNTMPLRKFFHILTIVAITSVLSQLNKSSASEDSKTEPKADATKSTPLGVRQQSIKRMVAELENQFSDLARLLQEENPDQASKLIDAFKASKEMLLEKRMDDITKLLDLLKLDSANEEQKKTIDDIKGLIEFLLKEDDESERIKKEIEKLKKWKADLESLIQDESELKDESELRSDKDKALEEMDRNIAELKRLIDKQKEIKEDTDRESTNGIEGLDKIADAQNELRKETEKLQESLGQKDKNDLEEKNKPANLMKDAVNDQKLAEQKLGEGKGKPAAESESEAIDKGVTNSAPPFVSIVLTSH